jgi:hypothetical protein
MNFTRHVIGGSLTLLLVACGGSTAGNGGDGGPGGSCAISAGTYTQHFTAEPGGTNCPAIPDQTITINGTDLLSGDGGSLPADGGDGCATSVDSSRCTFSVHCTMSSSGFSSTISTTFTFHGSSATGKESITDESGGRVFANCTYDIAMTKQ